MSQTQGNQSLAVSTEATALVAGMPVAALNAVADKLRTAGFHFALLDRSGALLYQSAAGAAAFKTLFTGTTPQEFGETLSAITATSMAVTTACFAGFSVAILPHVEKRQVAAVVVLARESGPTFGGADAAVLAMLPMVPGMLRDQIRLGRSSRRSHLSPRNWPTVTKSSV